jgi:hypothetical protein
MKDRIHHGEIREIGLLFCSRGSHGSRLNINCLGTSFYARTGQGT